MIYSDRSQPDTVPVEEPLADATLRARNSGVLASLPRRPRIQFQKEDRPSLQQRDLSFRHPSSWTLGLRTLRWGREISRMLIRLSLDRLQNRWSLRQLGQRLRECFEAMGGTAIKLGQQLAIRVDFLPFEICDELGLLMDRVPPFPAAYAIAQIELMTGCPIQETFEVFEEQPIGSASIACVFRGRLRSGEQVAIKVRRPHIAAQFLSDLTIFSHLTHILEALALVRPELFKFFRIEIFDMFISELDFNKEANYQNMFRHYVRRDRIHWLSAPRVFHELSNVEILTSEFINGYSCSDLLKVVETADAESLALLASQQIDPAIIGRRIMLLALWGRLECPFFHGDPHPGNILIRPDNQIIMLDFGSCGLNPLKQAEHQMEMGRRLVNNDISGGTAVAMSVIAPLPKIDIPHLRRRVEKTLWDYQIIVNSKDAAWWERTTAALWIAIIETTREFQLPITMDVLRMTRATLLYDTVACRLNPKINAENTYRRWMKQAVARIERRKRRRAHWTQRRSGRASLVDQLGRTVELVQKAGFLGAHLSRELPKEFIAASSQGSYIVASLLKISAFGALLLLLTGTISLLIAQFSGINLGITENFYNILQNPYYITGGMCTLLWLLNQFQIRLNEKDIRR